MSGLNKINFFPIALLFFLLTSEMSSQNLSSTIVEFDRNRISVTKLSEPGNSVVDITSMASSSLKRVHQNNAYSENVRIRYRDGDAAAIISLADSLSKIYSSTKELLHPLKLPNLEVFLIRSNERPSNYRITSNRGRRYYPLVLYYSHESEIDFGCDIYSQICDEVFSVLPHELTHIALAELIDPNDISTRWFDEGVAKHVETIISQKYARPVYDRDYLNTFPEVSLDRNEIRESLWNWNYADEQERGGSFNSLQVQWNLMSRYGASGQLIRTLLHNDKKGSEPTPLSTLLGELLNAKGGRPLSSAEIVAHVYRKLNVDITTIGQLTAENRKELARQAELTLVETDTKTTARDRRPTIYWALSVLVCLDSELSRQGIGAILDVLVEPETPAILQHLAATSLSKRIRSSSQRKVLLKELKDRRIPESEFITLLNEMAFEL